MKNEKQNQKRVQKEAGGIPALAGLQPARALRRVCDPAIGVSLAGLQTRRRVCCGLQTRSGGKWEIRRLYGLSELIASVLVGG